MMLTRPKPPSHPRSGGSRSGGPLSTRGGTITVAAILSLLAGIALLVFLREYREDLTADDGVRVVVSRNLIPHGTPGEVVAEKRLYTIRRIKKSELAEGAVVDPADLEGKVAKKDLFPGHQLKAEDFKDDALYFVAPGGDFEGGAAGWKLEDGAVIAGGSSAFSPLGSGQHSLQLRGGSVATSPAFCVDERYPSFRVTIGQLGTRKAKVRVSVVYPGLERNVRKEADLDGDEKDRWRLSKRLDLKPGHGLKRGGWRLVALRFEVLKDEAGADVRIDDVLVDPLRRF